MQEAVLLLLIMCLNDWYAVLYVCRRSRLRSALSGQLKEPFPNIAGDANKWQLVLNRGSSCLDWRMCIIRVFMECNITNL
jgi:hypothetical protein